MESLLDAVAGWGSSLLQTETTKMTFAFLIAARLHRSWVKKDIAEQVKGLTDAINNIGNTMSENFLLFGKRLDDHDARIQNIEKK